MDELKSLADELYGLSIEVESYPAETHSPVRNYAFNVLDERQLVIIKVLERLLNKMAENYDFYNNLAQSHPYSAAECSKIINHYRMCGEVLMKPRGG